MTTVLSFIHNDNDLLYRKEVIQLVEWCKNNNLAPNVNKTKDDLTENTAVEVVTSPKFQGVQIIDMCPGADN